MKKRVYKLMIFVMLCLVLSPAIAQEWEKTYSGFDYIFTTLEFPENQGQTGYAAGGHVTWNGNGIVIKTTDGGDTWTSMWTGNNQGIEGMSFPTVNTGFVVGFSGYFGKTTDGGDTWTTIDLGITPEPSVFYDVIFKDENNGIVFPLGEPAYITNDGGASWSAGGTTPGLVGAACYVSDNTYFAVGSGHIMKTEDGGLTWTSKFNQAQLLLTGIRFFDENQGFALSEDGKYLETTDGGDNWTQHTIGNGFPLWRDVARIDDDIMYIAGTPEQIWKTTDGGATWEDDYPEGTFQQAIYEIQALPDGTLIAGASQGYIFRKAAPESDYPFTEDFEGSDEIPAGWTVYNQSGDMTWAVTDLINNTPGGSNAAFHNFAFGMQDTWLTTPQISMPDEGNFFLNFWQTNMDIDWYHKNSVMVSTGSPDPADGDYVEVWTEDIVPDEWAPVYIDLEGYAGEDIYIAFRYEGDNAHIWIIDDVALGEEVDADPVMVVDADEVEQSVAQNGTSTNRFSVFNEGIGTLDYAIEVDYIDQDGWLTVEPSSGTVGGNSSQFIDLTFSGSDYDLGLYEATITITGNDTNNPEATVDIIMHVMDASPVNLVVLQDTHTFPVAISENGQHVVGTPFGGGSGYYWSEESGVTNIAAAVEGVSDDGEVVVTYDDPDLIYNGNPVTVAGRWSLATDEFEFLGMNPAAPEFFMNDYSSGYGISSDGATIVGMQYYPGFNYKAFSWSEDVYDNIGDHADLPEGNRPNGITANGEVVYGWAQTATAPRSPVIWHDDEIIFIDETSSGEAYGGSPNGQFITGELNSDGFVLNTETGEVTTFQNTLNDGMIAPAAVSSDGYVFGFTAEGFPPLPSSRRAFVRHPGGNLTKFNDYAVDQGWFDAESWTFYAITGVSGDGNRFIGAGIDPDGNDVSFMIDFAPLQPEIEVNPMSLTEFLELGETSDQTLEISNTGEGDLTFNAVIQYLADNSKIQEVPLGRSGLADRGNIQLDKKEGTDGFHPASRVNNNDVILNYDGANVDAIGLVAGGTFYGAARYTSEMVAPFGDYMLESVDVYIGDVPTEIKLMVWDAGTTTTPGALLHEQIFSPTESSWNTVTLDEALEVSGADLWIGFEITHDEGVFVLGIDGGPANMDGNWLSEDAQDWEHLSDYGLNGNWNIRARLQYGGVQWLSLDPASGTVEEGESLQVTVMFNAEGLQPGIHEANLRISSNAVNEGLLILPVTLEVGDAPMYTLTLMVNPEDAGEVTGFGEYYSGTVVTVNATAFEGFEFINWTDEDGMIVSEVAENEISMPAEDLTLTANFESTVSVEELWTEQVSIYPNPASNYLYFLSGETISTIEIFNLHGQKVYYQKVNDTRYRIDVSSVQAGLFLVRIVSTDGKEYTEKVHINK